MAAVGARDTKPELTLRRFLHAAGLRYRLNVRSLPGKPDLVFPRHRAVTLAHGCFWHGHDCPLFVTPRTRTDFWLAKIAANQRRDRLNHDRLRANGWRIATVWECALRGRAAPGIGIIGPAVADFVRGHVETEMHGCFDGCHVGSGYEHLRLLPTGESVDAG